MFFIQNNKEIHLSFKNSEKQSTQTLRKSVYPCQYMDSWERFDKTSLPDKKVFQSAVNLEDITDKGSAYALCVQSNTLLPK